MKSKITEKIRDLARLCKRLSDKNLLENDMEIGYVKNKYWICVDDYEYSSNDLEKALNKALDNLEYDIQENINYWEELKKDYSYDHYREWKNL